jgi:hypothetical protein
MIKGLVMFGSWWVRVRRALAVVKPKIRPALSRVPLTLYLFGIILIFGVLTQTVAHQYLLAIVRRGGWDLIMLHHGRFFAPWIGLFFSPDPDDAYGLLFLILLMVGPLEYRRGTGMAAFVFLFIGPLASIIDLLILWPISNAGVEYVRLALNTPDMGSSTACLTCLGVFLMGEKGWRRNAVLLGVLAVLGVLFYRNAVYNFDHLGGYAMGIAFGALIWWLLGKMQRRREAIS